MTKIGDLIIYGVLLAMTLSSCGESSLPVATQPPNPCASEDISEFIVALDDIAKRFEDVALLAENTAPENLKPIIEEMQVIEQEFINMDTPPCALRAKAALESYIFSKIQCHFHIYAVETVGEDSLPERKTDVCSLALDQLEYYQTQRDALRD